MARDFLGRHVIAELHGCDPRLLDDAEFITEVLLKAAKDTKVTVVDYVVRKFEPQGVSAVIIISESHITIHTWPELEYAALDFYTCGEEDPEGAVREIASALKTKNLTLFKANRGNMIKIKSMMDERKNRAEEKNGKHRDAVISKHKKEKSADGEESKKKTEKGEKKNGNSKEKNNGNDERGGEKEEEFDKTRTEQVQILL